MPNRIYRRFSLKELRAATNDFDEDLLIEKDDLFRLRLYKGCMVGGTPEVMIKRYDFKRYDSELTKIVSAEIQVQSLTPHPSIVSLIGFCYKKHKLILVYEYMVNGTLRSHLWGTDNDPLLWKKRLQICIDVARGVEYLHTNKEQQFIHRHIKASNILLDDKWVAKVAAFELSVLIQTGMGIEELETGILGTSGYIDPEYLLYGKVTKKSDVYSFGALLIEVLCARNLL